MTTKTAAKDPKNQTRTCRLTDSVLTIRVGDVADQYLLTEVGCDHGRAFKMVRGARNGETGRTTYTTHVSGDGLQNCTCRGFTYRQNCRHTSALRALIAKGRVEGGYPAGGDF